MSFRILLAAILALACGPASAATSRVHPAPPKLPVPPMQFYVVKGAPDACGRGCDSWIAIEGKIDSNAAARFRKFFARVRGRNLPLYLYSPGGNVEQALAMGGILRERPVVARVGRTMVNECGFEAQDGDACLKLKQSGRELHGDISTRGAFCGSACPYLILGAATREIAADAALAVHSAKITVSFRGPGVPPAEMVAAANVSAHERSDHMIAAYLARMGAGTALLDLVKTVKFEEMHVLTREEIVRFGIDRREFVETPWTFEPGTRSMMHKVALQRREGEKSFRTMQWRVICLDSDSFELDFQRPRIPSSTPSAVSVSGGASPLFLFLGRAKTFELELWGARIAKASVQALLDSPQSDFTETVSTADGHKNLLTQKLSNEGLANGMDKLLATCPAPKAPPPQTVEARGQAAK